MKTDFKFDIRLIIGVVRLLEREQNDIINAILNRLPNGLTRHAAEIVKFKWRLRLPRETSTTTYVTIASRL
jgi:hypothetical protein